MPTKGRISRISSSDLEELWELVNEAEQGDQRVSRGRYRDGALYIVTRCRRQGKRIDHEFGYVNNGIIGGVKFDREVTVRGGTYQYSSSHAEERCLKVKAIPSGTKFPTGTWEPGGAFGTAATNWAGPLEVTTTITEHDDQKVSSVADLTLILRTASDLYKS